MRSAHNLQIIFMGIPEDTNRTDELNLFCEPKAQEYKCQAQRVLCDMVTGSVTHNKNRVKLGRNKEIAIAEFKYVRPMKKQQREGRSTRRRLGKHLQPVCTVRRCQRASSHDKGGNRGRAPGVPCRTRRHASAFYAMRLTTLNAHKSQCKLCETYHTGG